MVLVTETAFMFGVVVLLFNAWRGDAAQVWPIYVVAVLISAMDFTEMSSTMKCGAIIATPCTRWS